MTASATIGSELALVRAPRYASRMAGSRVLGIVLLLSSSTLLYSACGSSDGSNKPRGDAGRAGEPSDGGEPGLDSGGEPGSDGGSGSGAGGAGDAGGAGGAGGALNAGAASGGLDGGGSGAGSDPNGAGAGAGAAGGAGDPCSGPPRCVTDQVAGVCSDSGELETFECTNGCEAGACLPTILEGWLLHQYTLTDDTAQIAASYSFSEDGLSALQTQNSQPSLYYLDKDLSDVVIRGSFGVETSSDDDLIGFVFGLQDTEHFYLFDWKQTAQADPTCGDAAVGASLKRISAEGPLQLCRDFWSSGDTTDMVVLVPPAENPTGWVDNVVYDFELRHRPGEISIQVKQGTQTVVDIRSSDATYEHGRFGFYNYSQEYSRYQFFDIQPGG